MLYPLKFKPIYKEMVWGGGALAGILSRKLPFGKVGESWDVACRETGMSVISNGALRRKTLQELIDKAGAAIVGDKFIDQERFPLLIKIISAEDNLSVQVHPDDSYAQKAEGLPCGKSEMWYILHAPEDAQLVIGLNDGVTREMFTRALEQGGVESCLARLPVKPGDVIDIPAGLVHAITKGIVLLEVQQNSDITYRIYDYGRTGLDGNPRELHIHKALDVIDFSVGLRKTAIKGRQLNDVVTSYISNNYFRIDKYDISTAFAEKTDGSRFSVFTCVAGSGEISGEDFCERVNYGDSVLIPAGLGRYTISGACTLVKCMSA